MTLAAHQLINQFSGDTEYYTPAFLIEAAREVMGAIDLDPASSLRANRVVRATTYYCEAEDGRAYEWRGRVWLNHPFSREGNPKWINKLLIEHIQGRCTEFCCITFAATSETWFRPLLQYLQCFLSPRTNYHLPDGTLKRGVTKGSVVTYGGPNESKFRDVFSNFGVVK